ncbi:MAG TPA: regulatory iron-sulfur-containing complex subunit RicT [Anaerolineaceae bacterium]|nr:regulatory iron-sulfur-containing complex subunit RicT [Anaerolineaceae bacterium]
MAEQSIIGVQFSPVGKIYHFSVPEGASVLEGSFVLVNTARGRQLGKVLQTSVQNPHNPEDIQPIERVATEQDLQVKERNAEKEKLALEKARDCLKDPHYSAVKAFAAEYSYDGNRLTFYLNYEPDTGFDVRGFLREISHSFRDVRLEVRQLGPRDMAKAISGLGACGIEKRCCSKFLTEFSSISIKMAKSQDISLTPMEITGMCGRLRCCLNYEYETYEEARKNLPKHKKVVQTPLGEGKVIQVLPLRESVIVELPEIGPRLFTLEELQTGKLDEKKSVPEESIPTFSETKGDVEMLAYGGKSKPESSGKPNRETGNRRDRRGRGGERRGSQQGFHSNTENPGASPQQKGSPKSQQSTNTGPNSQEQSTQGFPERRKKRR